MNLRLAICVILMLLTPRIAAAQPAGEPTISVITLGPGPAIYERYGHVAIRIQAPEYDLDLAYDWGNFAFDDPNFLGRFIKGDTRYWMEGKPSGLFIDHYLKTEDRTITIRELNFTRDQVMRLIKIIRDQDDEEHRYYRYDYYRDNCSTRVRDVINEAAGGVLEQSKAVTTPHGYQWHNRRLLRVGADNMAILSGMELVSGPRGDAPLSEWEACYLPTLLGETLDRARFADGRPLVRESRVLNVTTRPGNAEPTEALHPAWWMLPIGLVCGGGLVVLSRVWPLGFRLGATAWELVVLVGAVVMPTFIVFTKHWVVAWDENFLQLTPIALFVIWSIWRRTPTTRAAVRSDSASDPTAQRSACICTEKSSLIALGLSLIGAVVTISHLTPQHNAPAVCLALPLHAAVFVGLRRLRKGWRHVSIGTNPAISQPLAAK